MTHVGGLISAVEQVRRRILADKFLRGWIRWCSWVLLGLLLLAAFSPVLGWVLPIAAALLAVGAGISLVAAYRSNPSPYAAACRLDAAAGLQDRLPTALYLAKEENPGELVLRQRQDALARLSQVQPRLLFPLRVPSAGRTLALLLAVAALFAYRAYFNAPVLTLLHKTAQSRVVAAILSPIVHAMEKDPQKMAGKKVAAEGKDGDKQALGAQDPADGQMDENARVADGSDQQEGRQQDQQAADPSQQQGDPSQQGQAQEDQKGNQAGESQAQEQGQQQGQQQGDSQQQQAGKSPQSSGGNGNGDQNQARDPQQAGSGGDRQSLAQSVMQALKNLLNSARGQQAGNPPQQSAQNGQPSSNQGSQQKGSQGNQNSQQNPSDQQGQESSSQSSSNSQMDGNQKSSTGIGTEPGSQEMHPNPALASKTNADRVPLTSTDFSGQARVRTSVGPGNAQVPLTEEAADSVATTNGAEQENIPQRYRMYVQKYFDHAGPPKTQAKAQQ